MAQINFNAANIDPATSFEALPAAWYNVMIVGSEMRPTKDGANQYLRLTLKVVDGQYANRQVFDNLNIQHSNPVATEIAQRKLSAYCHATGVIQVQDSSQLHGIPIKVRLSIRAGDGQYEPSNDIKDVKNINDPSAGTPAQGGQQGGFQQPQQGFGQQPQQGFQQQQPQQGFQQPQQQQFQQQPAQQGFQQQAAQVVQQTPFQGQQQQPQQGFQQQGAQTAEGQQQSAPTQGNPSSAMSATTSPSNPPWQQGAPEQQQQQLQPAQQQQGNTPPWA